MIIAHHLIFTNYGYWLPNDPRGSLPREVLIPKIANLGPHHYGRKQNQPKSKELNEFRERAQEVLKFPIIIFNNEQTQIIARGFAQAIEQFKYTCYACVIMPDHVHVIIRKHRDKAEQMIENLQTTSRDFLLEIDPTFRTSSADSSFSTSCADLSLRNALPDSSFRKDHPIWGGPGYKVFLSTTADMHRTIKYVEDNPIKIKRLKQTHPFVTPYNNWLPGKHPERS